MLPQKENKRISKTLPKGFPKENQSSTKIKKTLLNAAKALSKAFTIFCQKSTKAFTKRIYKILQKRLQNGLQNSTKAFPK